MAIWELAPGSPWNAILSFLVMSRLSGGPFSSRSGFCQYPTGGFEVGGGVDAARDAVDDGDVDPHPGLQRAQLLELLLLLQRGRGQRHEPFQRGATVGIQANVVVARTVAMGRRGAGEIERTEPFRADRRTDRLHHAGGLILF